MFIHTAPAMENPHFHDRVSVHSLGPEQWLYIYGHPCGAGHHGQPRVPCAVVRGTGPAYPMHGGELGP